MIEITWDKKKYSFPESWEEMTERQFLSVTRNLGTLLFQEKVTEEDLYARRIIALKEIWGVPYYKFRNIWSSEIAELLKLLEFTKKIDLDKQLIPSVSISHGFFKALKLVGPKTGLTTSCFDEFILADTFFINISAKKDFDQAYYLFAYLYRPIRKDLAEFKKSNDWNGDIREPFNATKCQERIPFLKQYLPKEMLVAVMYFYWGFREKNLLIYKTLFPDAPEDSEVKAKRKNTYGWADTRLELSGHKFGTYLETGKTNWRNIIFDMHREEEKRVKREKAIALARLRSKIR